MRESDEISGRLIEFVAGGRLSELGLGLEPAIALQPESTVFILYVLVLILPLFCTPIKIHA